MQLKEVTNDAKVLITEGICPKCNEGKLMFLNSTKPGLQERTLYFIHKCKKCGNIIDVLNMQYPKVTMMSIQEYKVWKKTFKPNFLRKFLLTRKMKKTKKEMEKKREEKNEVS